MEDKVFYGNAEPEMLEMPPLDDPVMEDQRQQAIDAEMERKATKLRQKVAALQKTNEHCQAEVVRVNDLLEGQRRKLQEQEQCISDVRQQLMEEVQQFVSVERNLRHLRGHLEVIARASDEDSMLRRVIINLLAMDN